MKSGDDSRARVDAAIAALLTGGAFVLRALPSWKAVFRNGGIRFQEADPWYYARLVANLIHHFPRMIWFDPYLLHPGGQAVPVTNFFDLAIASAAWLIGLGHPSEALALRVAAVAPPLIGALVVLPCFLMARALWGRFAAVTAGALAAFLPGQFLGRSLVGFVDHHVAEVFLTACCLALIVLAVSPRDPRVAGDRRRGRTAAGAGIALALYLLTWESGVFLVAVIVFWSVVYGRRRDSESDAAGTALTVFLAAALTLTAAVPVLPAARHGLFPVLAGAAVALAIRFLRDRLSPSTLILLGAIVAALAGAAFCFLAPDRLAWLMSSLRRLHGSVQSATVTEARPYLQSAQHGLAFWRDYGSAIILAIPGAWIAARFAIRGRSAAAGLIVFWSGTALLLTLAQTRFAYYFAVAVSVLASGLVGSVMPFFERRRVAPILAMIGILLAFVGPGLRLALISSRRFTGPNDEWVESLSWLRTNSPEPFGDADYLAARYPPIRASSYGVLGWWDYGYWIIGIAHRVPFTNPTQAGAEAAAAIFADESPGHAVDELRRAGLRYIVTDRSLSLTAGGPAELPTGKFPAILAWAGISCDRFFALARYRDNGGRWRPVTLYYPEYFQSFLARLQLFAAEAASPEPGAVWAATVLPGSSPLRIEGLERMKSFEIARDFVAADPGRRRIASLDPLQTCVPLEAVPGVRPVHGSAGTFVQRGSTRIKNVEIFEISPAAP